MSLYYSPSPVSRDRLDAVARELVRAPDVHVTQPGAGGFLWVGRDERRFGPAHDPATGVRVLCSGRLSWPMAEWERAENLPFEGGLGPRLLLERYLDGGIDSVVPFNGSTIVVIHDPRERLHHVATDQFGYHPCFLYKSDTLEDCVLSTFPDAFCADEMLQLSYDLVSMAEFLRAWRITPPHTYFEQVKYAGAATLTTFDERSGKVRTREYWRPFEDGFFTSIDEAAEALADALTQAISERTAIAERPLFFISGGADSRVMLFANEEREKITAVTIYEHESLETQIAEDLCRMAGVSFAKLRRDNDYYPRQLPDIVRWSGAMWSAEDSHYPGFTDKLDEFDPDLVMTACTTDWLFKGYGLEKDYWKLVGKPLPFFRMTDERIDGFLPNIPLPAPEHLTGEIDARMDAWFDGCPHSLKTAKDRLRVEDRRVRPACYTVSVSGQIMYRTFPYDTFFADERLAQVYSRSRPEWKLNRELWGKAAAIICKDAGDLVDSNWGWRIDAGPREKAIAFAKGWLTRRLKRAKTQPSLAQDRPPPAGSWPEYGWYAEHSATLNDMWDSANAEERARMRSIANVDPWSSPLASFRNEGSLLFRIMTLLNHWRQVDRRRCDLGLEPIT